MGIAIVEDVPPPPPSSDLLLSLPPPLSSLDPYSQRDVNNYNMAPGIQSHYSPMIHPGYPQPQSQPLYYNRLQVPHLTLGNPPGSPTMPQVSPNYNQMPLSPVLNLNINNNNNTNNNIHNVNNINTNPPPRSPTFSNNNNNMYNNNNPLSFSQGLPPPSSPLSHPLSYSLSPLSLSQGVPPPLSFSQGVPPPSSPSPLSLSQPIPLSSLSSLSSLSLSSSQGIEMPPPLSPTFLHPPFSPSFSNYQPSPHSPTFASATGAVPLDAYLNNSLPPNFSLPPIPPSALPPVLNQKLLNNLSLSSRLSISMRWVFPLEIKVNSARGITSKKKDGTNDAKCKLVVEGQTRCTKVCKKVIDPQWDESFKFNNHESVKPNVSVAIYNNNIILADDEICKMTIPSIQVVDGTQWFPLQPKGEINLTILSHPTRPDSYRLNILRGPEMETVRFIDPSSNSLICTYKEKQKGVAFLRERNGNELLYTKTTTFPLKTTDIFEPNQTEPIATLTSKVGLGIGVDYQCIIHKSNITVQIKADGMGTARYLFLDQKHRNLAFIQSPTGSNNNNVIEIAPDQEILIFLICGAILGSTTHT